MPVCGASQWEQKHKSPWLRHSPPGPVSFIAPISIIAKTWKVQPIRCRVGVDLFLKHTGQASSVTQFSLSCVVLNKVRVSTQMLLVHFHRAAAVAGPAKQKEKERIKRQRKS